MTAPTLPATATLTEDEQLVIARALLHAAADTDDPAKAEALLALYARMIAAETIRLD